MALNDEVFSKCGLRKSASYMILIWHCCNPLDTMLKLNLKSNWEKGRKSSIASPPHLAK